MRRPARSSPVATVAADPKGAVEPDQGNTSSEATWTRQDVWREVQPLHVELDRLRTELKEAHGRNNRQESFVWEAAAEANGLRAQLTKLRQSNNAFHAELVEATAIADAASNGTAGLRTELVQEGEAARGACDVAAQQERRAGVASIEAQQEAEELHLARSRLAEIETSEVAANRALAAMRAELEVHGARQERRASETSSEAQQEAKELHVARSRLAETENSEVAANQVLAAMHAELEIHRAQEMHWLEHARHAKDVAHREELAADAAKAEAHSEAEEARLAVTSCQDEQFLVGLARRKAVEEAVAWRLAQAEAATFGTRAKKAAAGETMWHEKALRWHASEITAGSASAVWREEARSSRQGEATLRATLAMHETAACLAEENAEAAVRQAETEQHKTESLSAELTVALQRCKQRSSRLLPRTASEDLAKSAALPLEMELSTSEQRCMLNVATGRNVGRRRSSRTLSETPKKRSPLLEDDHLQTTGSLNPPLAFNRAALPPLPRMACKSTSSLDPTFGTGMSHAPTHQPIRLASARHEGQPSFASTP